jgi:hypothetical protein
MPRPFVPSRPSRPVSPPAAPVVPESPLPTPEALAALDRVDDGVHRLHEAIAGFADLLWFVSVSEHTPSTRGVAGWQQLVTILAEESARVGASFDALDRLVRPTAAGGAQ